MLHMLDRLRKLLKRREEHESDCKHKRDSSAIYQHIQNTQHSFEYNKIKILDQESNLRKRLLSEMLFIHCQNNSLNRQYDIRTI